MALLLGFDQIHANAFTMTSERPDDRAQRFCRAPRASNNASQVVRVNANFQGQTPVSVALTHTDIFRKINNSADQVFQSLLQHD